MSEAVQVTDSASASVSTKSDGGEKLRVFGTYHFACYDAAGNIKWEDDAPNTVTDAGAILLLNRFLNGSAWTPVCYMGLKGAGTVAVTDTQASHAGWSEQGGANAPAYTGSRKTVAFATTASGTGAGSRTITSSSTQTFAMTASGTVDGAFLNIAGSATKDDTTGTLFSAGTFSSGSKAVANGDTLTVSYTLNC